MAGNGDHSLKVNRDQNSNKKIGHNMPADWKGVDDELNNFDKEQTTRNSMLRDDMSTLEIFWEITKIAVPLIFAMLVFLLVQLVNTYFVGHCNDAILLAGVGMGNMLINVLCFAVVQGLNGALETFVSQSFGSKNYEACGIYLWRGKLVATLVMIPIVVIYCFADRILIGLG